MERPLMVRDLLRRLNKTVNALITRELGESGITMAQLMVIREVIQEVKTIGQISKALDLSYSTVSGIIDRLEREQLVERVRDERDRRVIWIRKTDKLQDFLRRVPIFSEEYYNRLFQGISEQELDAIIHALHMLIAKLEKES
jgi:DNA-binding MarR family transcriptional regulator